MLFRELKDNGNGWFTVFYTGTWKNSWEFMLDAVQNLVIDFGDNLQRVAYNDLDKDDVEILAEVKANRGDLRRCPSLKTERSTLSAAGVSSVMGCPLQVVFINQSAAVGLDCPVKEIFEEHGEHVFDNFMNSVEIRAYCADAARNAAAPKQDFLQ